MEYVIEADAISKKYKGFELSVPKLAIPKGFATALIGANGAGKTTLLSILSGVQLQYQGQIKYFGEYDDRDRESNPAVKEQIGYTAPGAYYLPQWRLDQVADVNELLFENFHRERFEAWCQDLHISTKETAKKKIGDLSDGNRMKLIIAGVLARDTKLLLMDEPASPLDPVMRDKLCELIRNYLNEEDGQRSVFFSTHNIADMENVTDYAIIMSGGRIVEDGFVEDLKEKYLLVKGEIEDVEAARTALFAISENKFGFEGICLAENMDRLAGCRIAAEVPTLTQISVAVMKHFGQEQG